MFKHTDSSFIKEKKTKEKMKNIVLSLSELLQMLKPKYSFFLCTMNMHDKYFKNINIYTRIDCFSFSIAER